MSSKPHRRGTTGLTIDGRRRRGTGPAPAGRRAHFERTGAGRHD